jgi:aspartyl protease family protein
MMASSVSRILTRLLLVAGGALCACLPATAATVSLGGILGSKAVLLVDGQRRVLAVGESSPEGVKLLEVSRDVVRVEMHGQARELRLGGAVGGVMNTPAGVELRIPAVSHGHYVVTGLINGQPVEMMVDSGASLVSMTAATARRLNIPYHLKGEKSQSMTANGLVNTYLVTLDSVKVGPIELSFVQGSVRESNDASPILLGMSFLGQLQVEQQNQVMVLRRK